MLSSVHRPGDPSSNPVLVIFCHVFPLHKNVRHFEFTINKFNHKLCPLLGLKLGHLKDETYLILKLVLSSNLG